MISLFQRRLYAGTLRLGTPRARTNNSSKDAGKGSRLFVGDWPIVLILRDVTWQSVLCFKKRNLTIMAAGDRTVSGQISWFVGIVDILASAKKVSLFKYLSTHIIHAFWSITLLQKNSKNPAEISENDRRILCDSRLHSPSTVATVKIAWQDQRDKLVCISGTQNFEKNPSAFAWRSWISRPNYFIQGGRVPA